MSYEHRYFFCLQPPVIVGKRIGLLRDELHSGGTIVADHRFHVTLGITDNHPRHLPDIVDRMTAIGESVDAEPFRLSLNQISAGNGVIALRPSRRPAGLMQLQRQLGRRLAFAQLRRKDWSFNPHVTLLYQRGAPTLHLVPLLEWDATELVLIHSIVRATTHVELGRWPLIRRQQSFAF